MTETESNNSQENSKDSSTPVINLIGKVVFRYDKYIAFAVLIAISSFVTILIIAADDCRQCFNKRNEPPPPSDLKKYWVYGKDVESGYLRHVFTVLERLGYENDPNSTEWDLLWAHDYPFRKLWPELKALQPHQRVNHFPGCGYITNKVDLATSSLKYIPRAFKLPHDKQKLLEYATANPDRAFVEKNNDHRNIRVKKIDDIDLESGGTFVQEFVDRPLLVNGHKFDIGIYTIITSIDPLRVYIYNGDALLRFCPVKYYPFDPNNLDKYVVGDDYLPIWQVPALDYYYNQLGFGMRESLNSFLESTGRNPATIWEQIEDAIRVLVLNKEPNIVDVTNKFRSKRNFFEMMRFDFVVDEELNVFLLEANMSPNLSSAHFPPNQQLYEQVLYNVMGLLGLGERIRKDSLAPRSMSEQEMLVSYKNIATFPKECNSQLCRTSCMAPVCQLCSNCLSPEDKQTMEEAYLEYINRGACKRIFPPTLDPHKDLDDLEGYSAENQLLIRWFYGKCLIDNSWC